MGLAPHLTQVSPPTHRFRLCDLEAGDFLDRLNFNGAKFTVAMKQHLTYTAELSNDLTGNITRINNALEKMPQSLENHKQNLIRFQKELESAKEEVARPFPQEEELMKKSARLAELNIQLDQEEKNGGTDLEQENQEADGEEITEKTGQNHTENPGQNAAEPEKLIPASNPATRAATETKAEPFPSACTNPSSAKPAPVSGRMPENSYAKPSILTQLKQFSPSPPVSSGRQREVFER